MGTDALACMGARTNGMIYRTIGAGLNPPPAPPVPDPSPLEVVPDATDDETDALSALVILFEVL